MTGARLGGVSTVIENGGKAEAVIPSVTEMTIACVTVPASAGEGDPESRPDLLSNIAQGGAFWILNATLPRSLSDARGTKS